MQKNCILKETLTLPPNVRGKKRGLIELEITHIKWNSNYLINRFEHLEIIAKLFWWGQSKTIGNQLNISKTNINHSSAVVQYSILTNCKLFYNYLINCEPIKIQLFTKTSNFQIGVVTAKIPLKVLKGCYNFLSGETIACTEIQKYKIVNVKGTDLGEITIKFKMMFHDPISDRENLCDVKCQPVIPDIDKETEKIFSSRSNKSTKDKKKNIEDQEILSSRIVDYLSGRKMSKKDEEQALHEIQRTSPLSDKFLDNLNINIPKSPEALVQKLFRTKENQENIYCQPTNDKMDSLHLNVKYLKLLPPGIREVYVKSLIKTTFTVECKISPNILDSELRRRLNYDVIRFYANTFDDKEQRIDFNKDAVRSVKLICNERNDFSIEHSELLFTVWWREYGSRYSRCLGTTKFRFTNLLKMNEQDSNLKLKVKSCTAGLHVADLHCKITLGSNLLYIGTKLTEKNGANDCHKAIQFTDILCPTCNTQHCSDKIKKVPNNENNAQSNLHSLEPKESTTSNTTFTNLPISNMDKFDEKNQDNSNVQTTERDNLENLNFLKGLLYIGEMQNINNIDNSNYFCVTRAFWKDDPSSSGYSYDNNFNFIEVFSIINDSMFLDRVRNNILIVEMWQKSRETHEKLFGIIRLPLHQFYIAFRDPVLANHLFKAKLPVISIDGLSPIVSPLSGIVCGQIQALLCIGTEEQLKNLQISRGYNLECLLDNQLYKNSSNIPIPQFPENEDLNENLLNSAFLTETAETGNMTVDEANNVQKENNEQNISISDNKNKKEKLSNILGNFLDNVSQKLPPCSTPNSPPITNIPVTEQQSEHQNSLRRTSDLLDMLQRALMQPVTSSEMENSAILQTLSTSSKTFKLLLEIECALHLPRNPLKMISKKSNKRNKAGKQSRFPPNEEPSAYVTFQAEEGYGQMFKSHEGMVYATNVVEKCSNPSWGKRFDICLSTEFILKENKPFILRVWKKAATDLAHCRLLPTPMEDSIIGVASVDLTVLMARMPFISGWYNIIDFSGKINGQIKLNIKPLEDVLKFKAISKKVELKNSNNTSFLNSKNTITNNLEPSDLGLGLGMDMSLSRAFKRKIVELEEINQRLRARLLDVTGEADPDIDLAEVDDEQMDEFERDLNTECKEDDIENNQNIGQNDNFAWLQNQIEQNGSGDKSRLDYSFQQNDINKEKIKLISEFLKKTEISGSNKKTSSDNENK